MRIMLLAIACVLSWASPAKAETPVDLAPCLDIIQLIPDSMSSFEVLSCRENPAPQTRAELLMVIPADDVIDFAQLLTNDHAMSPLRFVCCGYEASTPATFAIPEGSIAAGPQSTLPNLEGRFAVSAIDGAPLGLSDGLFTLTLEDV